MTKFNNAIDKFATSFKEKIKKRKADLRIVPIDEEQEMGEELKTIEELKIIKELKMIEEIRKVENLDSIQAIYSFHGDKPSGIVRINDDDKNDKNEKNEKKKQEKEKKKQEKEKKKQEKEKKKQEEKEKKKQEKECEQQEETNKPETKYNTLFTQIQLEPVIEDSSSTIMFMTELNSNVKTPRLKNNKVSLDVKQSESPSPISSPISSPNSNYSEETTTSIPQTPQTPQTPSATINNTPKPIINNPMMARRPVRRNSGFRMGINLMR